MSAQEFEERALRLFLGSDRRAEERLLVLFGLEGERGPGPVVLWGLLEPGRPLSEG